jgi:hypothetical protein
MIDGARLTPLPAMTENLRADVFALPPSPTCTWALVFLG